MGFDTERFIAEVEKRPYIWNSKCMKRSHRKLKQKAWKELAEVFGGKLPKEKKIKLASNLKNKWRNIRDCFVKVHKAKKSDKNYPMKKKPNYVFYDRLKFLEEVVNSDVTHTSCTSAANDDDDDEKSIESDKTSSSISSEPKIKKKTKTDDLVGREIRVINGNNYRNIDEIDENRLFFLSLVKEFKKIPKNLQIQTKLDLLKVIKDAQCRNMEPAWNNAAPTSYKITVEPKDSLGIASNSPERSPCPESDDNSMEEKSVSPISFKIEIDSE